MKKLILLFVMGLLSFLTKAATIKGIIKDGDGLPVPYVNVLIKGTTKGVLSNAQGYYSIQIGQQKEVLVFRFVGYKVIEKSVDGSKGDQTLNVLLETDRITLNEIVVTANNEDPAMEIMRQAIAKREFYLNQVKEFSCRSYIKGLNKTDKAPKKILGQDLNIDGADSNNAGVVYFSESVSDYHFKYRRKEKEIVTASKVSGNPNGFSFNRFRDINLNLYENKIEDLPAARPFVSPLASSAMVYYKYKLISSQEQAGDVIHKIELAPRRKFDPVFRGFIYIQDKTWRLTQADMYITKEAGTEFVDTLTLQQIHAPATPEIWRVTSSQFSFKYSILGIKGRGYFLSFVSDYDFTPHPEGFFDQVVEKIEDGANKKDSAFWEKTRVVPLTPEEIRDYHRKDSIRLVKDSDKYKDSIDKKANRLKWNFILLGYRYQNSKKEFSVGVNSLLNNTFYNPVEGLTLGPNIVLFKRDKETDKVWNFENKLRYGFALKRLYSEFSLRRLYNPKYNGVFTLDGGNYIHQLNGNNPISPYVNTAYALFEEQSFMKLYEKLHITGAWSRRMGRGLNVVTRASLSRRSPLDNTIADLRRSTARVFSPNRVWLPNDPADRAHNGLVTEIGIQWRPGENYMETPTRIIPQGSRFPLIGLQWRKGWQLNNSFATNFDLVIAGIQDDMDFGLLGSFRYRLSGGWFINTASIPFMDRRHFMGTQVLLANEEINTFLLLPYYSFSTTSNFVEGHIEHNFAGFFTNKLPLIRRLKFHEVVGVNYLSTDQLNHYTELTLGLANIFKVLRVDYARAINGRPKPEMPWMDRGGVHAIRLRMDI